MNFVAYYRVSTKRQGESGLGLEAQQSAVKSHVAAHGGRLVATFTEVESGKRSDRPQLAAALSACKRYRAVLLIAKLDRLARNVAFVANLMEAGSEFVACDMPHANRLTIHILAAMAEHEAQAISARTKAALAQAKARGVLLGSANPKRRAAGLDGLRACQEAAIKRSAAVRSELAQAYADTILPAVHQLQEEGVTGLRRLADGLNRMGIRTRRGGLWQAEAVRQLLARAA